ncbi:MAG: hypothetical protein WBD50_05440 [Candidatus Rhabdochlamydia sp.]
MSSPNQNLYFKNGFIVSDTTATVPDISLALTFIVKSSMSGISTDTGIVPCLVGSLNGESVVGSTFTMPSNYTSTSSSAKSVVQLVFTYLSYAVTIGMAITLFAQGCRWMLQRYSVLKNKKGTDPSSEEQEKLAKDSENLTTTERASLQKNLENSGIDETIPTNADELSNLADKATLSSLEINGIEQVNAQKQDILANEQRIEQDLTLTNDPAIQTATQDLLDAEDALKSAVQGIVDSAPFPNVPTAIEQYENLSKNLATNSDDLSELSTNLDDIATSIAGNMSNEQAQEDKTESEASEAAEEELENFQKAQDDINDGNQNDDADPAESPFDDVLPLMNLSGRSIRREKLFEKRKKRMLERRKTLSQRRKAHKERQTNALRREYVRKESLELANLEKPKTDISPC